MKDVVIESILEETSKYTECTHVTSNTQTFPMRVIFTVENWDELSNLYAKTNYTLSFFNQPINCDFKPNSLYNKSDVPLYNELRKVLSNLDHNNQDKIKKLKKDIDLLDKSIIHWGNIIANNVGIGPDNCPLCIEYRNPGHCLSCPIKIDTNRSWCEGTPYNSVIIIKTYENKARMLNYLINLYDKLRTQLNDL